MTGARTIGLVLLAVALALGACGKKGDPKRPSETEKKEQTVDE